MIHIPKGFSPAELLDPQTFRKWGADGLRYMDQGLLAALGWIRANYPAAEGKRKIVVNDWSFGGNKRWRTLRLPGSEYYREYSAHSWGRAIDFTPHGISMPEFHAWLMRVHAEAVRRVEGKGLPVELYEEMPVLAIRRIEAIQDAPSWMHIDSLEHASQNLLIVRRTP